jgi:DNA-binding phage protein
VEIFQEYTQDNDTGALLVSLRVIARVQGISDIAEQIGMTRKGVEKDLSDEGNPCLGNVTSICIMVFHPVVLRVDLNDASRLVLKKV